MPLLQSTKTIYHHPLDAVTGETVVGTLWTLGDGRFDTGKVGQGLEGTPSTLDFITPVAYAADAPNFGAGVFAAARLDATRIAIIWAERHDVPGVANAHFGSGRVATIDSGPSISFAGGTNTSLLHSPASFDPDNLSLRFMDTDKCIAVYRQNAGIPNSVLARVIAISGSSISGGVVATLHGVAADDSSVDAFDPTSFVAVYRIRTGAGTDELTARVGTVSGTSIVLGSTFVFATSASPTSTVVATLSSTKALVAYKLGGVGRARVIERTGTSLSFGPEVTFTGAIGDQGTQAARWAVGLTATTAVVMNGPTGSTAHLATVSGVNVTFGPGSASFESNGGAGISVSLDKVNSTTFVFATSAPSPSQGKARTGFVSGTSISPGVAATFTDGGGGGGRDAAVVAVGSPGDVPTHIFVTSQDDEQSITVFGHPADATVTCLFGSGDLTATSGAYPTTVGSSKLAYTAWLKDPSSPCP